MIVIEKGVPFPKPVKRGPRWADLDRMEVGDSFVVTVDLERTRLNVSQYGKTNNKLFTVRKQEDGTHRCWRLK